VIAKQEPPSADTKVAKAGGKEPDPKTVPEEKKAPPQAKDPDRGAAEYVLSIGGTVRINDEGGDRGAADLPREAFQLTYVSLNRNKQVRDADLVVFKDCKNLTYLDLGGVTQVSDEGLAYFAGCKNLTILILWQTQVSDVGLGHFKDCKNLTKLWLDGTPISDAGLKNFAGMTKLEELYLAAMPNVTAAGGEGLAKALPLCKIHFSPA
jgi:eukaryotic-like serine/threonine-protein kinase